MSAPLTATLPHRTVGLFVLWVLLSESYTLPHMAVGLAAAYGVALLNTDRSIPPAARFSWIRMVAYVPWIFVRILKSGIHLSYLILHPRLPIEPLMIAHRTKLSNETAIVILGNSITLTPGTLTAEANGNELMVHALDEESLGDVTSLLLDNKIATLFGEPGGATPAPGANGGRP